MAGENPKSDAGVHDKLSCASRRRPPLDRYAKILSTYVILSWQIYAAFEGGSSAARNRTLLVFLPYVNAKQIPQVTREMRHGFWTHSPPVRWNEAFFAGKCITIATDTILQIFSFEIQKGFHRKVDALRARFSQKSKANFSSAWR